MDANFSFSAFAYADNLHTHTLQLYSSKSTHALKTFEKIECFVCNCNFPFVSMQTEIECFLLFMLTLRVQFKFTDCSNCAKLHFALTNFALAIQTKQKQQQQQQHKFEQNTCASLAFCDQNFVRCFRIFFFLSFARTAFACANSQ